MNIDGKPNAPLPRVLEADAPRLQAGASVEIGPGLVVDAPSAESPAAPARLRLPSGRRAEFDRDGKDDLLTVSAADGRVELTVRFTEAGPVLSFEAAGLRLRSAGEVAVACERFRVEAAEEVSLRSGGTLRTESDGATELEAGGAARVEGHAVEIRSRRGDVDLKANDDVRLRGERVKLNC